MENKPAKQEFPPGIIIFLVYIGWRAFNSLITTFRIPSSQLGPFLLTGTGAIIVNLVVAGIIAAIFYGTIKRFKWARKLAIGWFSFSMTLLAVNLIYFLCNTSTYINSYKKIFPPESNPYIKPEIITASLISALLCGLTMGIIIIIYFIKKKDFFVK